MSAETHHVHRPARVEWRSRAWGIVGALSITETVSWGILYYAFAAFLIPMHDELGYSTAQLTGAFSLALAVSAVAGVAVGRHLDRHSPRALMTAGSMAGAALAGDWDAARRVELVLPETGVCSAKAAPAAAPASASACCGTGSSNEPVAAGA